MLCCCSLFLTAHGALSVNASNDNAAVSGEEKPRKNEQRQSQRRIGDWIRHPRCSSIRRTLPVISSPPATIVAAPRPPPTLLPSMTRPILLVAALALATATSVNAQTERAPTISIRPSQLFCSGVARHRMNQDDSLAQRFMFDAALRTGSNAERLQRFTAVCLDAFRAIAE